MSAKSPFWEIPEGVVVRDAYRGDTYAFATIRFGEKSYFDVACNEDGPLNDFGALKSGDVVRIAGRLGKRKLKGVTDPSGRSKYEISLNAVKLAVLQKAAPKQPEHHPAGHDADDNIPW